MTIGVKMIRYKKITLALAVFLLACIPLFFVFSAAQEKVFSAGLNGTPVQSSYEKGSDFELDKTSMTIDGQEVSISKKRIYFPDNRVYSDAKVTLDVAGKYVVEYSAEYGGETYVITEEFDVYDELYSLSSLSDTASYGANPYAEEYSGLNVSLMQGSVFQFDPIIDFSKKTKDDTLISFVITPSRIGVNDFTHFYVKLTDIYDENNYVVICVKSSPDGGMNTLKTSFVLAGFNSDKLTLAGNYMGIKGGETHYGDMTAGYGFAANFSFSGYYFENADYSPDSKYQMRLAFDYRTKELYAETSCFDVDSGNYLISLTEDFDTAWTGFTTGEARLSIFADGYSNSFAKFNIDSIYDYDLSSAVNDNIDKTYADIDFGEYDENGVPDALVGYRYEIFDAAAQNRYGEERLFTSVYYNYNSDSRYLVESKDGYFVPERSGNYTIEYAVKDRFGNYGIRTVEVRAVDQAEPIVLTLTDGYPLQGTVASPTELAGCKVESGGLGNVHTQVTIRNAAGEVIEDDAQQQYTFYESGNYTVTYTAKDYVGRVAEKSYVLSVGKASSPVFEDAIGLPRYFMKGHKYHLADYYAGDYSSGVRQAVKATVSAEGGTLTGNTLVPEGEEVRLTYTAVSASGVSGQAVRTVPVIDVKNGEDIDILRYFVTENFSGKVYDNRLAFTMTAESGSLSFINSLIASDFTLRFFAEEGKEEIRTIKLTLTDRQNDRQSVVLTLTATEEGTYAVASGGVPKKLSGVDISSPTRTTEIRYDGAFRFGNSTVTALTYENGEPFDGFGSGKVYLRLDVAGEADRTALALSYLCGQPLNSMTEDQVAPKVAFSGEISGRYEKNTEIVIPAMLCADVLDSETYVTLSVEDASGYVTSEDGVLLQDADSKRDYRIKLGGKGKYIITYTYRDGSGNGDEFAYIISVKDDVAPQLSVDDSSIEVKAGAEVTIAKATATDDVSTERKIKIVVFLKSSNGIFVPVGNGGTMKVEEKGIYELIYVAIDESGNVAEKTIKVTVS